jgi:hypothetical protein
MENSLENDRPAVAAVDLSEKVKKSERTSSLVFILADTTEQDKRRIEALAAAHRYILSDAWGKA